MTGGRGDGHLLGYRSRLVDQRLSHLLEVFPAVLVNGPRAAGKTTTAAQFCAEIVRLDQPARAVAFRADPDAALALLDEPALIDEWQEVPEVLGAVKRAVDADGRPGRFILTGSVRAELEQRMWPGTGRLVRLPMFGLTEREILGSVDPARPSFLERLVAGDPAQLVLPDKVPNLTDYIQFALRGGFPEAVLRPLAAADRQTWLDGYLEQLLLRDVRTTGHVAREPEKLRRYFEAVAANTAGMPSEKTLHETAAVNAKTAAAYDDLLTSLFVLERIPAWSTNRLSRLTMASKRYIVDPGLVGGALALTLGTVLADGGMLGRLIDTFALAQLRPEAAASPRRFRFHHLRTQGGRQEVDLVVELEAGRVFGIEIKATAAPGNADARHLRWLRDSLGDRFVGGAVLHTGPAVFRLDRGILAVPICAAWG
jgi:predicted AAA+ superfamily ATPase